MFVFYRFCPPQTGSHDPSSLQESVCDRFRLLHPPESLLGCRPSLHACHANGSRLDQTFFTSQECFFKNLNKLPSFPFFLQLFPLHLCGFPNFSSCSNRCGMPCLRRTIRHSLTAKDCRGWKGRVHPSLQMTSSHIHRNKFQTKHSQASNHSSSQNSI